MESEQSVGLEEILNVLRRRILLIVVIFVAVTAVAYAYSASKTKTYTAVAALSFNSSPLNQEIVGLTPLSSEANPVANLNKDLEIVQIGEVANKAAAKTARRLGGGLTPEAVIGSIGAAPRGESGFVQVESTWTSGAEAALIANTYVDEFAKQQRIADHAYFQDALGQVEKQLAELSAEERLGSDGIDLQQRKHTLKLLDKLGYNDAEVAQKAVAPSAPSAPRTKRNTLLGALLGLALGIFVAFALERLDRKIRTPKALADAYGSPLLGLVPNFKSLSRRRGKSPREEAALPLSDAEVFSLIRARLSLGKKKAVRTVLVASPASGDGKTTVARFLAEAGARSGIRTLLIEADLRQPSLAKTLQLREEPGLVSALVGTTGLEDAIHSVPIQEGPGGAYTGQYLNVLLAGGSVRNSAELLEGESLESMMATVHSFYDFVVIDTPPVGSTADAFPLIRAVDGVLVVGRIGQSKREAAESLRDSLADLEAPVLGVVANGTGGSGQSPYLSAAGSAPTPLQRQGATSAPDFGRTVRT